MPTCGRYGCACNTCQKCFDKPCTCWQKELAKKTREYINRLDNEDIYSNLETINLLNEWLDHTKY
jgi:hypothetical protein